MSGVLGKCTSSLKPFKKRWFHCDCSQGYLSYHGMGVTHEERKLIGMINLHRAESIRVFGTKLEIRLRNVSKVFQMKALSEKEAQAWYQHLLECSNNTHSPTSTPSSSSPPSSAFSFSVVERKASSPSNSSNSANSLDPPFPLPSAAVMQGQRLNTFEGIPGLDFHRDVLAKIPEDKRPIYEQFSVAMDQEVEQLVQDNRIDSSRFWQRPDHFTKLRFLQSDEYDIAKAVVRLSRCLVWRQQSGFEDFVTSPDLRLYARYRALRVRRLLGVYDKCGRPLIVERLGNFLGDMMYQRGITLPQFGMCYAYDVSLVFAEFRRHVQQGHPYAHQIAYVADLRGVHVGVALRTVSLLKSLSRVAEANFCHIAGPISLVNAPSFVSYPWGLCKNFLSPHVVAKVSFSSDSGLEDLDRLYGLDCVPQEYGGRYVCELPRCATVNEVFEKLYPSEGLHLGLVGME